MDRRRIELLYSACKADVISHYTNSPNDVFFYLKHQAENIKPYVSASDSKVVRRNNNAESDLELKDRSGRP